MNAAVKIFKARLHKKAPHDIGRVRRRPLDRPGQKLDSYRAISARAAATPTAKLESQIIGLQLIESTAAAQNAASIKNRAQLCRVRLSPFGVRLVVLLMLFISVASNAIGVESGAALFPARRRRAFI
jgi:hypothetical protein